MPCDPNGNSGKGCPAAPGAGKCPGVVMAGKLGDGFDDLVADYHARIWGDGGTIPHKYKYLMALATAVTGREKQRALLEANKALAHGATPDEIRETMELAVWLGGSPLILQVAAPVMRFVEKRLAAASGESPAPAAKPS